MQFDWLTAFWPITWEPEFSQMWDWWWIINNISFHFTLFTYKGNDKIFQKIPKTVFLGYFGPFLQKFGQNLIILEKRALSVFKYSNYLPLCENQKKFMTHSWEKCWTGRWTNKQIDNDDFTGLSVGRGLITKGSQDLKNEKMHRYIS